MNFQETINLPTLNTQTNIANCDDPQYAVNSWWYTPSYQLYSWPRSVSLSEDEELLLNAMRRSDTIKRKLVKVALEALLREMEKQRA